VLKKMSNLHNFIPLDTTMGLRQDDIPSFTALVGGRAARRPVESAGAGPDAKWRQR
jgi:hypothetical protein